MSARLVALPGGGGMPGQLRPTVEITARRRAQAAGHPSVPLHDWAAEPETVFVPLTPLEWSLIHVALVERGTGSSLRPGSQAHADLADKVRAMVRGRTSDDCPPHGHPRPS